MTTNFPCASCGGQITYSASKCQNCGHAVTSSDIEKRRGAGPYDPKGLLGCIFVPAFLAFAGYLVWNAGPTDSERLESDVKLAQEYELKERNARLGCNEWQLATACSEMEENAALARHYRQRVNETLAKIEKRGATSK